MIRTATQLGTRLPSERMRRVLGSIAHVPVLPGIYQDRGRLDQDPPP